MNPDFFLSQPHRRHNPLKDEWVLVSPQRTKRPWRGQQEKVTKKKLPTYDSKCYLCPGNIRANGERNPQYKNTYVFANDFPAIIDKVQEATYQSSKLFQTETVRGVCRVVCFSERHDITLAEMTVRQIELVIDSWIKQVNELKQKFNWAQVFENKGQLMGCSNPHPHGQIWASNFIPNEIYKEDREQKKYFEKYHSSLLFDYLQEELKKKERTVVENDSWIVVVPFWAVWPFETLLLPITHIASFTDLSSKEKKDLASIIKKLLVAYDKLFNISMSYSMGWHFAPFNEKDSNHWQLHAHYYPPLLRSATVRKFMVGYEMLAEVQRDITAEQATSTLRNLL